MWPHLKQGFCWIFGCSFLDPLTTNPTKKHLSNSSAFKMSTNCLSVFDHFVGLAFKVLIIFLTNFVIYTNDMVFYWNSPPVLRPFVFLLQFSHVLINFNGMSRCPKLYVLSLLLCVVNTICFVFIFSVSEFSFHQVLLH